MLLQGLGSYREVCIVGKLVGTSQLISSQLAGKPSDIIIAYIKYGSGSLHLKTAICQLASSLKFSKRFGLVGQGH